MKQTRRTFLGILAAIVPASWVKPRTLRERLAEIKGIPSIDKRAELDIGDLPLPIVHRDFWFSPRTINVMPDSRWQDTPVVYEEEER